MTKLKLSAVPDDKPVTITVKMPAAIHRDLVAYAEILARTTGPTPPDPSELIAPCSSASWPSTRRSGRRAGQKIR